MTNARTTDPWTSHKADVENLSKRERQINPLLVRLYNSPEPMTAREIAENDDAKTHMALKRLPDAAKFDLVAKGPVRQCKCGTRPATTWLLTVKGIGVAMQLAESHQ